MVETASLRLFVVVGCGCCFVQKMECFDMCFPHCLNRASHIVMIRHSINSSLSHEAQRFEINLNYVSLTLTIVAASSICSIPPFGVNKAMLITISPSAAIIGPS